MARILVAAVIAAASATLFLPAATGAERLGFQGPVTEVAGKRGLGVDAVDEYGIAKKLGVVKGSFIYRVEVKYGNNKVDKQKTDSFEALQKALSHDKISEVKVVWRKDGQWYENSYQVVKVAAPKKIHKPD